jgi:hypothetical protein
MYNAGEKRQWSLRALLFLDSNPTSASTYISLTLALKTIQTFARALLGFKSEQRDTYETIHKTNGALLAAGRHWFFGI